MLTDYEIQAIWSDINKFTGCEAVRNGMSLDKIEEDMDKIRMKYQITDHEYDLFRSWAYRSFIISCNVLKIVPRIEIQFDEEEKEL